MSYQPNPAAVPAGISFTRQLSQRDVSLQIPINYVTAPAIALTPACFAEQRYEDGPAVRCFSNLLAIGFRRFEIDLYWDSIRKLWSLCPVELEYTSPNTTTASGPSPTTETSTATSSTANFTAELVARDADAFGLLDCQTLHEKRGASHTRSLTLPSTRTEFSETSLVSIPSVSTTVTLSTATGTGHPTANPKLGAGTLIDIGPYSCTSSINLTLLTQVMSSHLDSTQTNINATLKYMIFNLHAAAPASDPTGNALTPNKDDFPNANNQLGNIITSYMSKYIYTPSELQLQRSDLNASGSWYNLGRGESRPSAGYYGVSQSGGHYSTLNGWPSESFVEQVYAKRLLLGLGRIDPQMQGYNVTADAPTVFSQGYVQHMAAVTTNNAGGVESGCFFRPNSFEVSSVNNSWATSVASTLPLDALSVETGNLTACGISPLLNSTLSNTTADKDFLPYAEYIQSTIWSWGANEPRNQKVSDDDSSIVDYRCAALSAVTGRWQAADCGQSHYSACRKPDDNYQWAISDISTQYAKAEIPCEPGTIFSVPNTALENNYLLHYWRNYRTQMGIKDELLWLNFNDLEARECWVIGQNSTCPYVQQTSTERTVLIPTIAGIIVFVLAGLTVFVKCASNRQRSKRRRRRGDDGWDYEGVPS